ncbi:hypothetical protein ACZ90_24735 [Streptomyces albus subsp. albus]|nr:hypothetical protein ACZ90_24735 [Streptomyces albus subsp. albus]
MRDGRTGSVWVGRLLLLAALVLGIVTMHTLGHPTQHTPAVGMTATPHAQDRVPDQTQDQDEIQGMVLDRHSADDRPGHRDQAMGHGGDTADDRSMTHGSGTADDRTVAYSRQPAGEPHVAHGHLPVDDPHMASAVEAAPAHGAHPVPGHGGLSPLSVCLAVLAAWTVVVLAAAGVSRRVREALAVVRAGLLHALRPIPPPGQRPLLTRLSVLRI